MTRMKHCCRNCHFLAREDVFENGQRFSNTWTKEEREKGQMDAVPGLPRAAKCRQGIWDTGVDPTLNAKLEEILDQNRKNECFFIEHSEGMLFDGADKLRHMRYENQNLKRSLVIANWGLYIAAFSALVSFIGLDNFAKAYSYVVNRIILSLPG